jgi:ribosomal protein S6
MSEKTSNKKLIKEITTQDGDDSGDDKDLKLYELGVNFVSTLEDKAEKEFESLKKLIEKRKGKIVSVSSPETITLAYPITQTVDSKKKKHNTAEFGWIKFEIEPEVISKIKEDLDLNSYILRFIILKTTLEASTEAKEIAKFLNEKDNEKSEKTKKEGDENDLAESDEIEVEKDYIEDETATEEDEVDKAIEDLVIEEEKIN